MTPVSYTDLVALREHLRAEAERAKGLAVVSQQIGEDWRKHGGHGRPITQRDGAAFDEQTRTATDAWLAADTRLRTLEALIARHDWLTTGIALAADAIGARHQLAALEGREDEAARDALVVIREAT